MGTGLMCVVGTSEERDNRMGERTELQREIGIGSDKTNATQRGVDWQFRIENARTKLKRLYPKIKT